MRTSIGQGGGKPFVLTAVQSGWVSGLGGYSSPADLFPGEAEWALAALRLADEGAITLEPTQTAISLGMLCGLGGYLNGQIVCLREEHQYEEKRSVYEDLALFATTPYPTEADKVRNTLTLTLPRLSLGIVVESQDPTCPLVGWGEKRPYHYPALQPGQVIPADYWGNRFDTHVRVPYTRLAVLREPEGEAGGVDYLGAEDSQAVLVHLVAEPINHALHNSGVAGILAALRAAKPWWGRLCGKDKEAVVASLEVEAHGNIYDREAIREALESG